ncbi:histidine kinase [Sphingomonas taxi]|uniref:histidine kinase n=1 Tax=Sphingomonas taxi TaxID=1549858 RepID=A0A097EJL0_9SPHN|nr:ATP-binding protein [Sphingomonas taxi]AIT07751.1 histidine kinase [Sphingomonas taxi]
MSLRPLIRGWPWLAGVLLLAIAAAILAGALAQRRTIAQQQIEVTQDARLRAALLDSEIARFRLLPLTLANDRDISAAIAGTGAARPALNRKLEALARVTGAPAIYVVGPDGWSIAASNWRSPRAFVGIDYHSRPYVRQAEARGEGSHFAIGSVSQRPGLYLAARTATGGVTVIKLEFDRIERAWARSGGISFVQDARQRILVTSRPGWRFATVTRATAPAAGTVALVPLGDGRVRIGGAPASYVAQMVPVSQPGWQLVQMRPVDRAVAAARLFAAAAAGASVLALGVIAWAMRQRVLATRRRTAELEAAVAERTADLRREAAERALSDARGAELREALRQANRLASLGQITASVAHETAQPVAAIRTYAETSRMLLDRDEPDEVRANLRTIAQLADRVGVVTAQLRAFSRRQTDELRPVSLAEVIDGALLIVREQLRDAVLDRPAIDPALRVVGGKVRLEQVLVNLVQNALDALAGRAERRITLTLVEEESRVRLRVADTGPGIDPAIAAGLFKPFNTSRAAGLGLGLVIAQDIMTDLGGWLHHLPAPGGAVFEIGMRRA